MVEHAGPAFQGGGPGRTVVRGHIQRESRARGPRQVHIDADRQWGAACQYRPCRDVADAYVGRVDFIQLRPGRGILMAYAERVFPAL